MRPRRDELSLIVAMPREPETGEPPTVAYNDSRSVAELSYDGTEPPTELLASLQRRLARHGLVILGGPSHIEPPQ